MTMSSHACVHTCLSLTMNFVPHLSLRYKAAAAAVLLMLVLQVLIVCERVRARSHTHTHMFVWWAVLVRAAGTAQCVRIFVRKCARDVTVRFLVKSVSLSVFVLCVCACVCVPVCVCDKQVCTARSQLPCV